MYSAISAQLTRPSPERYSTTTAQPCRKQLSFFEHRRTNRDHLRQPDREDAAVLTINVKPERGKLIATNPANRVRVMEPGAEHRSQRIQVCVQRFCAAVFAAFSGAIHVKEHRRRAADGAGAHDGIARSSSLRACALTGPMMRSSSPYRAPPTGDWTSRGSNQSDATNTPSSATVRN